MFELENYKRVVLTTSKLVEAIDFYRDLGIFFHREGLFFPRYVARPNKCIEFVLSISGDVSQDSASLKPVSFSISDLEGKLRRMGYDISFGEKTCMIFDPDGREVYLSDKSID